MKSAALKLYIVSIFLIFLLSGSGWASYSMVLILEGTESSTNFSMFTRPLDDNQMYGYHVYNLISRRLLPDKSAELIGKMRLLASKHQVPLWASEFGANTLDWTHKTILHFENHQNNVSSWAFWPWQRVPSPHSEKEYHTTWAQFVLRQAG